MSDPNERSKTEGDSEDALETLLATGKLPEWVVSVSEAEGRQDYPVGAAGRDEPTPSFRLFEWRGNAPDVQGAFAQALDAWAKHYGAPPSSATQAIAKRV